MSSTESDRSYKENTIQNQPQTNQLSDIADEILKKEDPVKFFKDFLKSTEADHAILQNLIFELLNKASDITIFCELLDHFLLKIIRQENAPIIFEECYRRNPKIVKHVNFQILLYFIQHSKIDQEKYYKDILTNILTQIYLSGYNFDDIINLCIKYQQFSFAKDVICSTYGYFMTNNPNCCLPKELMHSVKINDEYISFPKECSGLSIISYISAKNKQFPSDIIESIKDFKFHKFMKPITIFDSFTYEEKQGKSKEIVPKFDFISKIFKDIQINNPKGFDLFYIANSLPVQQNCIDEIDNRIKNKINIFDKNNMWLSLYFLHFIMKNLEEQSDRALGMITSDYDYEISEFVLSSFEIYDDDNIILYCLCVLEKLFQYIIPSMHIISKNFDKIMTFIAKKRDSPRIVIKLLKIIEIGCPSNVLSNYDFISFIVSEKRRKVLDAIEEIFVQNDVDDLASFILESFESSISENDSITIRLLPYIAKNVEDKEYMSEIMTELIETHIENIAENSTPSFLNSLVKCSNHLTIEMSEYTSMFRDIFLSRNKFTNVDREYVDFLIELMKNLRKNEKSQIEAKIENISKEKPIEKKGIKAIEINEYIISILQMLYYIPEFKEKILNLEEKIEEFPKLIVNLFKNLDQDNQENEEILDKIQKMSSSIEDFLNKAYKSFQNHFDNPFNLFKVDFDDSSKFCVKLNENLDDFTSIVNTIHKLPQYLIIEMSRNQRMKLIDTVCFNNDDYYLSAILCTKNNRYVTFINFENVWVKFHNIKCQESSLEDVKNMAEQHGYIAIYRKGWWMPSPSNVSPQILRASSNEFKYFLQKFSNKKFGGEELIDKEIQQHIQEKNSINNEKVTENVKLFKNTSEIKKQTKRNGPRNRKWNEKSSDSDENDAEPISTTPKSSNSDKINGSYTYSLSSAKPDSEESGNTKDDIEKICTIENEKEVSRLISNFRNKQELKEKLVTRKIPNFHTIFDILLQLYDTDDHSLQMFYDLANNNFNDFSHLVIIDFANNLPKMLLKKNYFDTLTSFIQRVSADYLFDQISFPICRAISHIITQNEKNLNFAFQLFWEVVSKFSTKMKEFQETLTNTITPETILTTCSNAKILSPHTIMYILYSYQKEKINYNYKIKKEIDNFSLSSYLVDKHENLIVMLMENENIMNAVLNDLTKQNDGLSLINSVKLLNYYIRVIPTKSKQPFIQFVEKNIKSIENRLKAKKNDNKYLFDLAINLIQFDPMFAVKFGRLYDYFDEEKFKILKLCVEKCQNLDNYSKIIESVNYDRIIKYNIEGEIQILYDIFLPSAQYISEYKEKNLPKHFYDFVVAILEKCYVFCDLYDAAFQMATTHFHQSTNYKIKGAYTNLKQTALKMVKERRENLKDLLETIYTFVCDWLKASRSPFDKITVSKDEYQYLLAIAQESKNIIEFLFTINTKGWYRY